MEGLEQPRKRQRKALDGSTRSNEGVHKPYPSSEPDSDSDSELPQYLQPLQDHKTSTASDNFYLDTIDRTVLDFDFSKECSISLSKTNVYACLVCGKYFQGRSVTSPAFNHAINQHHHVYLNLKTEGFYILPDNYKLTDPETLRKLDDIIAVLNPTYKLEEIDTIPQQALDLKRIPYDVGYVGLNNVSSSSDYANVVIQLMCHIDPIRRFYMALNYSDDGHSYSPLNAEFGLLMRKLWSNKLYKPHVSPHELLQLISVKQQQSPKGVLVWLLNHLHMGLVKAIDTNKKQKKSSIISKSVQGSIKITKIAVESKDINGKTQFITKDSGTVHSKTKFWLLTVKPPTSPLFSLGLKVPEVSLETLLEKYNGVCQTHVNETEVHQYKLTGHLPPYMIIHIDRNLEGGGDISPTVVKYPRVLDMSPYGDSRANYALVANIVFKINPETKTRSWMIHLQKTSTEWVTIQDLQVRKCEPELMFLDTSYLQLWKRIDVTVNNNK